jgi:hypothetical protein
MNLLARLKKAEDTINPPVSANANPCYGLSARMRERSRLGHAATGEPRPGSIAAKMRRRGDLLAIRDLA